MQIQPGTQSLQSLKAQQAWESRRANKTEAQKPAAQATPFIEIAKPELPVNTISTAVSPQWQRRVNEIQNIATKAGFIDVTEQDIRNAYQFGESLLADYRV
jgi:hypothetical protein